ncbi:hypothetical protein AB1Y20_017913 [Prymnesium parvum]|uniref:JmjC domain-containing protein n=1 Tax=Prymnesium parvum TaxID=97485 RepID=A0AB34JN15_PRYPA
MTVSSLAGALSELSSSRAAGVRAPASLYSELMLGCVDAGVPLAAYRVYEEAVSDGIRFGSLSPAAQRALRSRLPPEAEACPGRERRAAPSQPARFWCDPLPSLWVEEKAPPRSVVEFDCSPLAAARASAIAEAWELIGRRSCPVLLRGVGEHWPAVRHCNLELLRTTMKRGMVRVSPTPSVTFCRESHPDVQAGLIEPPSRTFSMATSEIIDRLHVGRNGWQPLIYGDRERVYLQALAPHAMMRMLDFNFMKAKPGAQLSGVLGRLWVSTAGTVSPLHFDMQDSYLCQIRGAKRMLLWPDSLLSAFQPYPDDHPLARRLQTSIVSPAPSDLSTDARLKSLLSPLEALLHPGDVLYFPSHWCHHTEAVAQDRLEQNGEKVSSAHSAPKDGSLVDEDGVSEDGVSFSLGFRTDGEYLL